MNNIDVIVACTGLAANIIGLGVIYGSMMGRFKLIEYRLSMIERRQGVTFQPEA